MGIYLISVSPVCVCVCVCVCVFIVCAWFCVTHTHTTEDVEFFSAERKCPNKDFGVDLCEHDEPWNIYTNVRFCASGVSCR